MVFNYQNQYLNLIIISLTFRMILSIQLVTIQKDIHIVILNDHQISLMDIIKQLNINNVFLMDSIHSISEWIQYSYFYIFMFHSLSLIQNHFPIQEFYQ